MPHLDGLLLAFLLVGWLLIIGSATLGLQRSAQAWLPLKFAPQVSADYSVDPEQGIRLAPVRQQIVEAVRQDALAVRPPSTDVATTETPPSLASVLALIFRATPTPTLTPWPGPIPTVLTVDAGGPYTGNEGSPISLRTQAVISTQQTVIYRWDLDNDGMYDDATGNFSSVVFYDEGEYLVSVQASDATGRVAGDSATVRVSNVPPTVNVGKDRYTDEGKLISFSAVVSDPGHDVLFYTWDFGDGTGEEGSLHPRHTYLDNGDYEVRLRVEDNDGGVTEASFFTYVANLPPTANAGADQVTNEGDTIFLRGTATDPGTLDTLTYAWDLDYDGASFTPDAFGPNISTVYRDGPANLVAALLVEDKDGAQTIDTVSVMVNNVVPIIRAVRDNSPVGEGSPVTLIVEATDVGDDTLTYDFDWDNNGVFDAVSQPARVSYTWYNEGLYTVGVRADDGDGGRVFTLTTVSAFNVAPTAIAGPVAASLEGSPVTFNGSNSYDPGRNDVLTYRWDLGDGSPVAIGDIVNHAYPDNNIYTATLRVTDDSGASDSVAVAVTILNANPVADAGAADYRLKEGKDLNLTATAWDPGVADVLSLAWDLDYDGITFDEDSTKPSITLSNPDGPASYVVALRVRDDDYPYPTGSGGEVGETIDLVQVTVDNVPPVARAGGPYYGHPQEPVQLTGTAVDVPADLLTYQWDLDGNGTYDLTGSTVITSWNIVGVYTVTLRVTDDDGGRGLDTTRVNVGNTPPIVDAGGPYTGYEGSPITLTGTGTDLENDLLTYTWDLDNDGVFETTGQIVSYAWPDNGVYVVVLRAEDNWGGVATDTATVTVNNRPPSVDAGGPYLGHPGRPVVLSGTAVDVPADTLIYEWDLNQDLLPDVTGQTVTNTWYATGVYMVTLRVTDDDGGQGLGNAQVTISNQSPSVEGNGPYTGQTGTPITLNATGSDPDNDPLTFVWDLDSDGIFETSGQIVTYLWTSAGTFTVTVRVDDGWGGVATDIAVVQVNSAAIVAKSDGRYAISVDVPATRIGGRVKAGIPGQFVDVLSFYQAGIELLPQRRTYGWSF